MLANSKAISDTARLIMKDPDEDIYKYDHDMALMRELVLVIDNFDLYAGLGGKKYEPSEKTVGDPRSVRSLEGIDI